MGLSLNNLIKITNILKQMNMSITYIFTQLKTKYCRSDKLDLPTSLKPSVGSSEEFVNIFLLYNKLVFHLEQVSKPTSSTSDQTNDLFEIVIFFLI